MAYSCGAGDGEVVLGVAGDGVLPAHHLSRHTRHSQAPPPEPNGALYPSFRHHTIACFALLCRVAFHRVIPHMSSSSSFFFFFFFFAFVFAFACVLQAIENRLLIRRLVFERLLYSEMGEFEKLRTLDIEYRISADISQAPPPYSYYPALRASTDVQSLCATVCRGCMSCRVVSCRVVSCRVVCVVRFEFFCAFHEWCWNVVSCVSCRVVSRRVASRRVVSCRVVSCRYRGTCGRGRVGCPV